MASRLYVGNLAYSTTDAGLRDFFSAAGDVKTAEVVIERSSGRSKGFGFVEMDTDEGAQNAIDTLNGKMLDQRPIRIDFAKPKEDRPRTGSGSYSGGSSSRSGGYSSGSRGSSSSNSSRSSSGSSSSSSNSSRREGDRSRDRDRDRRRDSFGEEEF